MKPTIFLLSLACLITVVDVRAQTNIAVWRPNLPTVGDSINRYQSICLDTNVTSFVVLVIYRGGISERKCVGNCTGIEASASSGAKIICSEIVSEPQPGVKLKLPARTFYVR